MAKKYRVTKTGRASSRAPNQNGRTSKKDDQGTCKPRWPWVVVFLCGLISIVAMGITGSTPGANGVLLKVAASISRAVGSVAGTFSMLLSFLVILSSIVKITRPKDPLPRFVWGLWVLLIFSSGIYHDLVSPWQETLAFARDGGGAGYMGALPQWLFRVALGRPFGLLALFLGVTVGLSLLIGKSPWTPFSLAWMLTITAWQWFRGFVAEFFRPQGPDPEEIELEEQDFEAGKGQEDDLSLTLDTPFSAAVSELRAKLSTNEDFTTASSQGPDKEPPVDTTLTRPEPSRSRPVSEKDSDNESFEVKEQPPLSNDVFYEFPSLNLLQSSDGPKRPRSAHLMEERAKVIEKTLLSFGVVAKVVNVEPGPAVTRYELQPGPGVKVASIVNLGQDLALALAAQDVRIEAPIPGRSAVGIEVPNKEISLVHLREVLESREFRNSKSPLTVALGKDISGRPVVTTLDRCLHLLIAGATGSGKSVCINAIITSLLYKARPDQVKMVMIDPKRVELSVWAKIPHLIAPVVSDPKKAAGALRWAIKEMESRYEKFTKVGTRDIDRYNQVATPPDSVKPAMPYIVVIIDELSDLMMVAPAEVEDAIFRLAQMARASGIYLVVATQRPSVDVLTGTIKANIPSRIAFAVSSQIDSRTILDMGGAEKLLGRGDMLFHPVGASKPLRAQGCYLSEREIDEVVSFVSQQAKPQFATGILSEPEEMKAETEMQEDPLFSQALRIVVEAKQASVSLLQRKLPIGYSRAARLIDAMEVRGYVGPYEGSKPREVKLTIQQYLSMFESGNPALDETAASSSTPPTPTPGSPNYRPAIQGFGYEVDRKGAFPKEDRGPRDKDDSEGTSLGDKFKSTYPRETHRDTRNNPYGRKGPRD